MVQKSVFLVDSAQGKTFQRQLERLTRLHPTPAAFSLLSPHLRQPSQRKQDGSFVSSVVFDWNASVREAETVRLLSDKNNTSKHASKRKKSKQELLQGVDVCVSE